MNINEKALGLAAGDVVKKGFRRRELLDAKSVRQQEAVEPLHQAWVVFNDSNCMHAIADPDEATCKSDDDSGQSSSPCMDTIP